MNLLLHILGCRRERPMVNTNEPLPGLICVRGGIVVANWPLLSHSVIMTSNCRGGMDVAPAFGENFSCV
jgi:hypothetical protein